MRRAAAVAFRRDRRLLQPDAEAARRLPYRHLTRVRDHPLAIGA